MVPCFAGCDSEVKGEKDAFRQKARALKGFGMEGGVDKYTGECWRTGGLGGEMIWALLYNIQYMDNMHVL